MTDDNRERDVWRAALASLDSSPPPGEGCPEREQIDRAAAGELDAENAAIFDHVATCPHCAQSWRLTRAIDDAIDDGQLLAATEALAAWKESRSAPKPDSVPVPEPSPTLKDRLRGWAQEFDWSPAGWGLARGSAIGWVAAAGLVLAFGWAAFLVSPGATRVRGGSPDVMTIASESPGSLPRDAFVLEWSGGPPDAAFALEVTAGPRSLPIDSLRGVRGRSYRVPEKNLAQVPSGYVVIWKVGVVVEGRTVWSPNFVVEIE